MSDIAFFTHAGATLVAETAYGAPAHGNADTAGAAAHGNADTSGAAAQRNGDAANTPPTYVLIHGIGMGRTIFADLVTHLGEVAPSRTIAIDLPGYGEAPEPARVLTMERTADLVAAFLRSRAKTRIILVGHSMGTQVVVEVAARHPGLVERVVLVAPTVNPRERTAAQQVLRLAQDLAVESPRVIFVGAREYLRAGPRLRPKFRAMLVHEPEATYPRVLMPALVLRGENDYVCSRAWCRFVAASLPDGRLAEVAGHGHETMIRDAAPAAALIHEFAQNG